MLSSANLHVSCTKNYWFDDRYELWHPVELLRLNESGTLYYVKRTDLQGLLNYILGPYMWVEPTSLDTFEENPNEVFTPHQVEYYKSIHPYFYLMKFEFMPPNNQSVSHIVINTTHQSVHILLFIIGH